ncbi:hypothetical protein CEXT_440221 [Caerostris extrusa]|uniref:Uncharacterized protein n=1 Tax=Caerostris extrusa TaxID=172846 RepID=A0AAV4XEB8_CAEEX|nr:hypothetical protein CEXT_440221 [Caerostris extrusa]
MGEKNELYMQMKPINFLSSCPVSRGQSTPSTRSTNLIRIGYDINSDPNAAHQVNHCWCPGEPYPINHGNPTRSPNPHIALNV